MSDWLIWLLLGGALCVAELFTGTFYLLLAGVAALAAAAASWLGLPTAVQFAVAAGVSLAGLPLVLRASRRQGPVRGNYDTGQEIELVDQHGQLQGLYSGSFWRVEEATGRSLAAGQRVRIVRVDGTRLIVSAEGASGRIASENSKHP